MAGNVAPVFKRGKTYHGADKTLSSSYGTSVGLEGTIAEFQDEVASTTAGAKVPRSNRTQTCMIVRNVSGTTLAAKRLCIWATGYVGKRVGGYARNSGATGESYEAVAGVVDELLPSTGVRNYDLFWLHVKGPCTCTTSLSNMPSAIEEGRPLIAQTAATSQAATAGYVMGLVASTNSTMAINQVYQVIGKAMTARTTNETQSSVVVDLDIMKC